PCSLPSRTLRAASGGGPTGPSLTAAARGVTRLRQVGTKKRPSGRTKKLIEEKGKKDTKKNTRTAKRCLTKRAPYKGGQNRRARLLTTPRRDFAHAVRPARPRGQRRAPPS